MAGLTRQGNVLCFHGPMALCPFLGKMSVTLRCPTDSQHMSSGRITFVYNMYNAWEINIIKETCDCCVYICKQFALSHMADVPYIRPIYSSIFMPVPYTLTYHCKDLCWNKTFKPTVGPI